MESQRLEKRLKAYQEWKKTLVTTVSEYRLWLRKHKLATEQSEQKIRNALNALDEDRLKIAFTAEFSRGKTELINAIFFSEYGRRLLPSAAGRTTMCPTELFYDHTAARPYIRLLPIESRLQDASLSDLKRDATQWVNYPLDTASADQVEECLREVVKTRRVSFEEAVRLGMYDPERHSYSKTPAQLLEIPKWRHALINFPHPLLKQGLSILDTPGLNALGSEPELTIKMLPSAHAVIFVLAADTGVTRTDLELWQNHIKGFHHSRQRGLMVVLNKIDTLWDELQNPDTVDQTIEKQRKETAAILGIDRQAVFPVSAKKALLAKVQDDQELLEKSALGELERYLSDDILNSRHDIIQESITADISRMLESTQAIVTTKLNSVNRQLNELQKLTGESQDVVEQMIAKTRMELARYQHTVNDFRASQKIFKEQAARLQSAINIKQLEHEISQTRTRMEGNWTTQGLKNNMQALFDQMSSDMRQVAEQSEQTRKLIRGIYRKFQNKHDFSVMQPKMFSIMRYRIELGLLYQEAEAFRKSPVTAMTEKRFVLKRFFIAMVSRARDIFLQARQEIDGWLKTALEPLTFQMKEQKKQIDTRLQDLRNIRQSRNTLDVRLTELNRQQQAITKQLTVLRNMHNNLNISRPFTEEERPRPKLVKTANA